MHVRRKRCSLPAMPGVSPRVRLDQERLRLTLTKKGLQKHAKKNKMGQVGGQAGGCVASVPVFWVRDTQAVGALNLESSNVAREWV